ncbi:hypothetical protein Pst134EB_014339 [Puccinia striiformis f. sp. tritici]|nr:hypothetical protein Pst134EB_014339 [Puccinia striiformis f. sp. tritici]
MKLAITILISWVLMLSTSKEVAAGYACPTGGKINYCLQIPNGAHTNPKSGGSFDCPRQHLGLCCVGLAA